MCKKRLARITRVITCTLFLQILTPHWTWPVMYICGFLIVSYNLGRRAIIARSLSHIIEVFIRVFKAIKYVSCPAKVMYFVAQRGRPLTLTINYNFVYILCWHGHRIYAVRDSYNGSLRSYIFRHWREYLWLSQTIGRYIKRQKKLT